DRIRRDSVRLAGLVAHGQSSDPAAAAQTTREIIDEEELLFRDLALPQPVQRTWKDVREHLEPGAAAVEIIEFDDYSAPRLKEARYVAMIVTHTSQAPELVNLGSKSFIESKVLPDYEALRIGKPGAGVLFAETIWKPIEQQIGGATRVYISGDGKLTSIAWHILPIGEDSLIDRYDLRVLSSMADLTDDRDPTRDRSAVLLGNIDFGPVHRTGAVHLEALPGTAAEIAAVESILSRKGWAVTKIERSKATASALNGLHSPRLLHIATHSFVQAGAGRANVNDLSGTGLFLAGANGEPGEGDHLLTAAAVRYLDLADTEMVVLAACDSGGGPVRSGEGVFGLPRSFIEAGAASVLMTLWRIPDRDAQRIMTAFYQYWSDGVDRHEALRRAIIEAKRQKMIVGVAGMPLHRNSPFYWGAFMFVGR
ncbi:MAG TPA: CHAT domain-containing protein, partial [Thermoanaerobaculia bacterium]